MGEGDDAEQLAMFYAGPDVARAQNANPTWRYEGNRPPVAEWNAAHKCVVY